MDDIKKHPLLGISRVLIAVLEAVRKPLEPLTRRIFGAAVEPVPTTGPAAFRFETEAVLARQKTRRAQTIVRVALVAVVLLIGICTSVFTAVTFTRMLVALWLRKNRPTTINI